MCNDIYVKQTTLEATSFQRNTHFSANKYSSEERLYIQSLFVACNQSRDKDISSHWETLQYFPLNQNLMVKHLPRDYALKTME